MTTEASVLHPPRRPKNAAEDGYGRAFRLSFGVHALLLFLVIFKSLVLPDKPVPYVPTLRVDMVGLPDLLKSDLKNISPSQNSKEITEALKRAEVDAKKIKPVKIPNPPKEMAEKDELVLHPKRVAAPPAKPEVREKKLRSALDRIKALDKISSFEKSDGRPVVIKGNQISKGSSLSGDAKESAETGYYDLLRNKLQENWSLPVWISRQNYSAQVKIFIDSRGRLRNFIFLKSSGNPQFDSAIKKTLEESQPFPQPPEGIAGSLQVDGIRVGFPL
jgi:TonB family protein